MKENLKMIDGYWIVFFNLQDNGVDVRKKIISQIPLTSGTNQYDRLEIAKNNNVDPIWDFYGMINIKNKEIAETRNAEGVKIFIGMNKEATAFYEFDADTFNIISYNKIPCQ